jgi:tetratricopeptide (TPR) repeat protein
MQALVNLGNCKFERAAAATDDAAREDLLLEARGLYDTALRAEPDCLEAIYNIGLAAKAAAQLDVALEQFVLLNGLVPNQV